MTSRGRATCHRQHEVGQVVAVAVLDQVVAARRVARARATASLTLGRPRTGAAELTAASLIDSWSTTGGVLRAVVTWPSTVRSWDRWFDTLVVRPPDDLLVVQESAERARAISLQLTEQPGFDAARLVVLISGARATAGRWPRGVTVIDGHGATGPAHRQRSRPAGTTG